MKRSRILVILVGTAALLIASTPGRAAMASWTITGPGGLSGFTVARNAFGAAKCDMGSPAVQNTQGTDGVAINVSSYRNRAMHFSWSSASPRNVGGLSGSFAKSDCTTSGGTTTLPSSAVPGAWTVHIPGDATWLIVEANGAVLVTLNLNAIS